MSYIFAFFAMFALDFVWARYTRNITAGNAGRAGGYAALIVGFNAAVTLGYVADIWVVVPAALGAFAGTYASLKWDQ
jgi:hypothetical protein